jgi:NADH-quinone oxidoreductase subunit J
MTFLQSLFYLYAATAVFSALMVVSATNTVRATLFLVQTFFATAGLWMLLHAEFLALILILVYVGAVMTLFLFVVMMLNIDTIGLREGFTRYYPIGMMVVIIVVSLLVLVLGPNHFGLTRMPLPAPTPADFSNIASLGDVLYTKYAYPFEVAAVLLLTAIIAAISLTYRYKKPHKSQRVSAQIAVRPEDRLRIVKMQSVPKINPNPAPGE